MVLVELKEVRRSLVESSLDPVVDFPKITCQSNSVGGTGIASFFDLSILLAFFHF